MISFPSDSWSYASYLHDTINFQDIEGLSKLLSKDSVDVNAVDEYGRTALHWAAYKKFEIGVKLLLESGANVDARDKANQTPLLYAIYVCDRGMTDILLENGANVNIRNKNGVTPLHLAAEKGFVSIMELLLNKGAEMNRKDKDGNTPLHIVVEKSNASVVKLLLDSGAIVNSIDNDGNTPLHIALNRHTPFIMASNRSCKELVERLLANVAALNEKDCEENSALHHAIEKQDIEMVEALLTGGAQVNITNFSGDSPLSWAFESVFYGNLDIIQMLLDWWGDCVPPRFKHKCLLFLHLIIRKHIIKVSSVNNSMRMIEYSAEFLTSYKLSCLEELERMKIKKFDQYSLHDVFLKNDDPKFFTNSKLEQEIQSSDLNTQFPIFSSYLKVTFLKAKQRQVLLNSAQNLLQFPLPYEIRRKVLSYLSNEDIRNVIISYNENN